MDGYRGWLILHYPLVAPNAEYRSRILGSRPWRTTRESSSHTQSLALRTKTPSTDCRLEDSTLRDFPDIFMLRPSEGASFDLIRQMRRADNDGTIPGSPWHQRCRLHRAFFHQGLGWWLGLFAWPCAIPRLGAVRNLHCLSCLPWGDDRSRWPISCMAVWDLF